MARRRKKAKKRRKHNIKKGECKVISTPAGKRNLCHTAKGMRFKKMGVKKVR